MPFQDVVLELGPHLYERGHVDLVEGHERCRGVLGLLQGPGGAQAHAVHLHARFIPTARSSGRRDGSGFRFLWSGRGGVVLLSTLAGG